MLTFTIMMMSRRNEVDQHVYHQQSNITIRVHQEIIVFIHKNNKAFLTLYDTDIDTYDDGKPKLYLS